MGAHLIDGKFQSDKYPTTPRGKVPLSVEDITCQDLLWEYAQRHREVDSEFSIDLETALLAAGFKPEPSEEELNVIIGCVRHPWRVGRKVGRTIYEGETLIGVMDFEEDAIIVVQAVNAWRDEASK